MRPDSADERDVEVVHHLPDRAHTAPLSARVEALVAGGAERALIQVLDALGVRWEALGLRRVHRRQRSAALAFDATLQVAPGETPDEAHLVVHTDDDALPADATRVTTAVGPVAVWSYPNDPFLPGLASAADPARVAEMLRGLGRDHHDVAIVRRAYRPARRAVLEIIAGPPGARRTQAFVKVLPAARIGPLGAVHHQLADAGLPVPAPLGVGEEQGLLVLEPLPGVTLRRALLDGDPAPRPAAFVRLSRQLAAVDLTDGRDPRVAADPARYRRRLTERLPELAPTVDVVIEGARRRPTTPPVTVHGDLQPRQLMVADGQLGGVLDLDGAGPGLVADDAGNLVTHLEAIMGRRPHAADVVRPYAAELVEAYEPVVGATALAQARAAAWLGLATGALRHARPGARALARTRIARAAQVLDDGA